MILAFQKNSFNGDRIFSVGDLIDKGPQAQQVITLLVDEGAELILGNHDDKLKRFIKRIRKGEYEKAKKIRNWVGLAELNNMLNDQERDWIVNAKSWHRDKNGFCIVHGGIEPGVHKMPFSGEDLSDLTKKERGRLHQTKWVRYLNPETGRMVTTGTEQPGWPYWADLYDGRFGTAYFGHQPYMEAVPKFSNAVALDTGCVYGGKLTGAVLNGDGTLESYISIPAERAYAVSHWGNSNAK